MAKIDWEIFVYDLFSFKTIKVYADKLRLKNKLSDKITTINHLLWTAGVNLVLHAMQAVGTQIRDISLL